jgi:hypothetical protein
MQTARILYDASGRLARVQQRVTDPNWREAHPPAQLDAERYAAWFWQSFSLLQMERMIRSDAAVHQAAVDMMLTAGLPATWRSYFEIRALPWDGEKAAIRYWTQHDPEYYQIIQRCLEVGDRRERLAAYRLLVERTLQPAGKVLGLGETAVILSQPGAAPSDARTILEYWDTLFDPEPAAEA